MDVPSVEAPAYAGTLVVLLRSHKSECASVPRFVPNASSTEKGRVGEACPKLPLTSIVRVGRRGLTKPLPPQQVTEPSVFTPQVWDHPALTEANSPPGGVD